MKDLAEIARLEEEQAALQALLDSGQEEAQERTRLAKRIGEIKQEVRELLASATPPEA